MYFLPKNNWAYSGLVALKPLHRWLVTLLCTVGIACGWFFGIYTPITRLIDRDVAANAHFERQHVLAQQSHDASEQLESSLKVLQKNLKNYVRPGVTPSETLQGSMALIFGIAQRQGVTIATYSVKKESKHELFMTHHIHMDCTGSLDALIRMLEALYAQHVIIEYEQVSLRRAPHNLFTVSIDCSLNVIL